MESHGNHWDCLGEAKDVVPRFIARACRDLDAEMRVGPDIAVPDPARGESRKETVLSFAAPEGGLCALVLIVSKKRTNAANLWSAYPFARNGVRHRIRVDEIQEWANGLEARIRGTFAGALEIGFFDTLYHVNRGRYEVGRTYDFVLAALAYRLQVADAPSIRLRDPERIAQFREFHARLGDPSEPDDAGPIELTIRDARVLLPVADCDIDEFQFQAPVTKVRDFDLEGQPILAIQAPLLSWEDQDLEVVIYASERVIEGLRPAPGDDIAGSLWLQGYLADPQS